MAVGELQPPSQEDPLLSKVISDRYRIIKKLGEGGMGAVYLAEHVFIEKKVALKVLAPELSRKAELAARFLQEAKSASRIGHENVIDISDFAQSPEGYVYFAMEYLQGEDLGQVLRASGAMAWRRARPIILQICKALGAAHAKGIIHRDMKPENVFLIERSGRHDFVKLLDFGIAKVQVEGEGGPKLTRTGMIFGTPEYMAPEQAEGKVCDQRADVYAVGCVIHHLLVGDPPFVADNFVGMLTKHLLEPAVPPSQRRPDLGITPQMDAVVLKALAKPPEQRFQNMAELMSAVEAIAESEGATAAAYEHGSALNQSLTRPFGGSDAAPVVAPRGGIAKAEVIDSDSAAFGLSERRRPQHPHGPRYVIIGVAFGMVMAVGWLLFARRNPVATVPPQSAATSPHLEVPSPKPASVTASPLREAAPAPAAKHHSEGLPRSQHRANRPTQGRDPQPARAPARDSSHIPSSRSPAKAPAPESERPVATPPELKGFPGQ